MPAEFTYKARDLDGTAVVGTARLDSADAVRDYLADRKLIPISIQPKAQSLEEKFLAVLKRRASGEDLILFTRKLNALYRAGIPLTSGLGIIAEQDGKQGFAPIASELRADLEQGCSLSEAIARRSDAFGDTYVHAIRVAEETGRLDAVLERLAITLERDFETREQIKTAIRYPIIVVSLVVVAFFTLVTFVVPKFVEFYGKNNAVLPLPTRLLIVLNQFIMSYWPLMLIALTILIPVTIRLFKLKQVRTRFDGLVLRLPVFGPLLNRIYIARFAHLLGVSFSSGAPLLNGLRSVQSAIGNRIIESEVELMHAQIQQGQPIVAIRHKLPHFPAVAVSLMQVGLESGSLDFMLEQIAMFLDREVDYTTKRLMTLIEPLLILFLGAVVLVMALAIFMPMWNLLEVFRPK